MTRLESVESCLRDKLFSRKVGANEGNNFFNIKELQCCTSPNAQIRERERGKGRSKE